MPYLADDVREAATLPVQRLAVGLVDGISKLAAHALLAPVLATPNLRLVCHDGEFEQLLGELALHHLDLVLAGQAAPRNPNLLVWHRRLQLIDHGSALYIHHSWRDPDAHARRPFAQIADHVLLPFASSIAAADERLAPQVTEALLREIGRAHV